MDRFGPIRQLGQIDYFGHNWIYSDITGQFGHFGHFGYFRQNWTLLTL